MTINGLKKILDKLCADGRGRYAVCVDKDTFRHPCEADGTTILNVETVDFEPVLQSDDDGGIKINKDGTESHRQCLVFKGGT